MLVSVIQKRVGRYLIVEFRLWNAKFKAFEKKDFRSETFRIKSCENAKGGQFATPKNSRALAA